MRKKTIEEIKQAFEKEGYELLEEEYINSKTKMEYKCPNGHKHKITWNSFQRGDRCPYCSHNAKLNINYIKEEFEKEGYILLEENYINNSTVMKYKCCNNHINKISWLGWQQGKRCPNCVGNAKLTIEQIRDSFEKEGYELLEEKYINANTKMKYKCPNGHIGSITWGNFQQGHRCSSCRNNYKGENKIEEFLQLYNIEYETQKSFKDCIYKIPLRFDFYLSNYNLCIEYDGEGHYTPIDFGGKGKEYAEQRFKEGQECDQIKNEYCKDNNIKLIRIPYWEFKNIENILKQELNLE